MSIKHCEKDCRPFKRICLDNADETCVRLSNSSQNEILSESGRRSAYSPGFNSSTESQSIPTSSEAGGFNPLTWHHGTHQYLTTKTHGRRSIKNTQCIINETREPVTTANVPLFDGTVDESPLVHHGLPNTGVVDQVCFGMVRLSCLHPLFTYHWMITHRNSFSLITFLFKYCNPAVET